ncbi:hypothetical protein [Tessaracoccus sp. OH4464_COT-324]|uniref:hypothetical protein n=1 Tax=Tessaracoccus sp. OH4464_COT-324 TaxID=2491059 RepID=UPI000F63A139|nr:hypothetical protein [Tessaracoccus sp. OH4464_COT-324]RRD46980.1 hypothetical protein EII42_04630 [Tessaracoccus sp. OH4464_COT-324]
MFPRDVVYPPDPVETEAPPGSEFPIPGADAGLGWDGISIIVGGVVLLLILVPLLVFFLKARKS